MILNFILDLHPALPARVVVQVDVEARDVEGGAQMGFQPRVVVEEAEDLFPEGAACLGHEAVGQVMGVVDEHAAHLSNTFLARAHLVHLTAPLLQLSRHLQSSRDFSPVAVVATHPTESS